MKDFKTKIIPFLTTIGGYDIGQPVGLRPEFSGTGALGAIISRFFAFVLPLAGIIGFIFFLWSGIQFLTSQGDPKSLAAAKARLTYAIIGLAVIFLAYAITLFITGTFGFNQI